MNKAGAFLRSSVSRLIGLIRRDRFSAAAKTERVRVAALALNPHLVGHSAHRWLQLPLADEGIPRRPYHAHSHAHKHQQLQSTIQHRVLLTSLPKQDAVGLFTA